MLSFHLKVPPVMSEIVRLAAQLSKDFEILPYDGIHVATAVSLGADEIVSADAELDKAKVISRTDPLDYAKATAKKEPGHSSD
jgi:predicted nucleic acid-binding protein